MTERAIALTVNGRPLTRRVPDHRLLREFLRDDLDLTGTKGPCDDGMCGACSVIVDERVVKSCLMLAVEAAGLAVTTVEGLADGETLHPSQQALADDFAIQCGYCTPGFAITLASLLEDGLPADEDVIRAAFVGNICRCTGYARIVRAAATAARAMAATASTTAPAAADAEGA